MEESDRISEKCKEVVDSQNQRPLFGMRERQKDPSAFTRFEGRLVIYEVGDRLIVGEYHEVEDLDKSYRSMQFRPCMRQRFGGEGVIMSEPIITYNFSGVMSLAPYNSLEEAVNAFNENRSNKSKKE